MTSEIEQTNRSDLIYGVVALGFNLVVLTINWNVAGKASNPHRSYGPEDELILWLLVLVTAAVNALAIAVQVAGRKTRQSLTKGLLKMYEDNGVAQYYAPELLGESRMRYRLFTASLGLFGLTAILIPLIVRYA